MRFRRQQGISISCIIIGVFFICLGVILGWSTFPKIVKKSIKDNIKLEYGLDFYKNWLKPPSTILFKVYFFIISNPEEVSQGGKPIFKEIGPYAFKKQIQRIHPMHFPDIDAIWYEEITNFSFDEENSGPGLKETDELTFLNLALLSTIWFIEDMLGADLVGMANPVLEDIFFNYGLFQKSKVIDLLFNGFDVVDCNEKEDTSSMTAMACTEIRSKSPPNIWETSPNIFSFGFMKPLNTSSAPPSGIGHTPFILEAQSDEDASRIKQMLKRTFVITKGAKNLNEFGYVREWAGESQMEFWSDECKLIKGTDSTIYSPLLEKKDIKIFVKNACRSTTINFKNEIQYKGLTAYHFELDPKAYNYSQGHNQCFCKNNELENCPSNGTIDLTACYEGHIIISNPHFLNGALELSTFEGLHPDNEKHKTYVDVDQLTGVPLRSAIRYQFNCKLKQVNEIPILQNVSTAMIPVLWIDEIFELDDINLAELQSIYVRIKLLDWIKWILIVLGIILILVGFYLQWKMRKDDKHLTELSRTKADVPKGAMQGAIHTLGRNSNINQISPVETILYPIRNNTKNRLNNNGENANNAEHSKLQD